MDYSYNSLDNSSHVVFLVRRSNVTLRPGTDSQYWLLSIFVPEAVAIVAGNILVLMAFLGSPILRKRKNFLLVNLAVADGLVGMVSMVIFLTINFAGSRSFSSFMLVYNLFTGQDVLFGSASIFALTSVALERMYATMYPLKHRVLSRRAYFACIAAVWSQALLLSLFAVFTSMELFMAFMLPSILLSLFTVSVCYSLIWYRIVQAGSIKGQNRQTDVTQVVSRERDRRLTVTLVIITVLSLITWLPFQLLNILLGAGCQCPVSHVVLWVTKFLQYGNSIVNPVVYALRMAGFRKVLRKQFAWAAAKNDMQVQSPTRREDRTSTTAVPRGSRKESVTQEHAL
ncbi:octopamine receptor beta-1R [Nematostella vectensis]|uniref:octopamine receptor beta-1R n=1 Tax=Nematostella vectensis TaxID=45351 RepID=UPI0020778A7B|nr:octopamine receptor beta-1R [Nematostella vectensis]